MSKLYKNILLIISMKKNVEELDYKNHKNHKNYKNHKNKVKYIYHLFREFCFTLL